MKAHKDEIIGENLPKVGWLGAKFGKGGHQWKKAAAAA